MLLENLKAIASRFPASSGLRADGTLYPYAQLAERAERLAAGFAEQGIAAGQAVAILLPNGPELFAVAYALFGLGAIALPLSIIAPPMELVNSARRGQARVIIARRDLAETALRIATELKSPEPLPIILSGSGGPASLDDLAPTPPRSLPTPGPEAPALYLFSSGSTGLPKVVPHTHGEMLANGRATATDFKLTIDDVVYNNLPGNHAMGFLNSVFEVPEAGASTFYFSDPAPLMLARGHLLQSLEREGVTILPGVPFMFTALAAASEQVNLSRLRLVYSAGISLKRPIFDSFLERYGFKIRQAYGCTEAGHVAFNREPDPAEHWDSVGMPVGDTLVEVIHSENAIGPDVGELVLRSSSVTKGYLNQPELNALAFAGGRFATGDLGRVDAAGNVTILGRSKLIVEVAGHKVDPLEVEEVLGRHPAVEDCVVVGVPNARSGEQQLKAVIVRRSDATAADLIGFCRERLSAQKVPAIIEFRDAIPRSATGKVLRGRLIEPA